MHNCQVISWWTFMPSEHLQKRNTQRNTKATSDDELVRDYPPQPPYRSVPEWYTNQNKVDDQDEDCVNAEFEGDLYNAMALQFHASLLGLFVKLPHAAFSNVRGISEPPMHRIRYDGIDNRLHCPSAR
jgi:hypothetical protein